MERAEKFKFKERSGCSLNTGIRFRPKLMLNPADNNFEREADSVSEEVMRMPDIGTNSFFKAALNNQIQTSSDGPGQDNDLQTQIRNGEDSHAGSHLQNYVENLKAGGSSLSSKSRSFFEPRFGYDFSKVRIHSDQEAAKSAQSINALAYTSGNNIVFSQNQFSPESDSGKKLLAHELTHVVQQKNNTISRQPKGKPTASTPVVKGAVLQSSGGYILQIDYIKIIVKPDVFNSSKPRSNQALTFLAKPTISISEPDYKLDPKTGNVNSFKPYPDLGITMTIETHYGSRVKPGGKSDYGYGTRKQDIRAGNTSITFHEGSHGTELINYIKREIKKHPLPKFGGSTGISESEFLKKDGEYLNKISQINKMLLTAIANAEIIVDCAGTSKDKHYAGTKDYVNICP